MNTKSQNAILPMRALPRGARRFIQTRALPAALRGGVISILGTLTMAGHAFAQATPSTAGIGAQLQNMAQEG